MKKPAFIISSIFIFGIQASAALQLGCSIDKLSRPGFVRVTSKDDSGMVHDVYWEAVSNEPANSDPWGIMSTGDYDPVTGELFASKASDGRYQSVKVCKDQKLSLPTRKDFEALLNCFEKFPDASQRLSEQGMKDLEASIQDIRGPRIWLSSTVMLTKSDEVVAMNGSWGLLELWQREGDGGSVKCVDYQKMKLKP